MRSATAPSPRAMRLGRAWYVAAVLSAVFAIGMCLLGWRQASQADKIAAHPVRVEGTVTQLPSGSGTYSAVSYRVDGQEHTAADLWLPADAKVGNPVCLERAASDASAVRVCGKAYPQAAGIRLAQASVPVALLILLACVARIWRHHRAWPERTGGAGRAGRAGVRATVAFASEAMGDDLPALTHGKRSRRRRKGGRRALR